MIEAITQCPECQMTFRVTEAQLRIAEGSVRCGACLHVFQAEDFLLSPLLDVTERLAIERDYWLDFDDYIEQVARPVPLALVKPQSDTKSAVPVDATSLDDVDDLMGFYLSYLLSHPGVEPSASNKEPSADEEPSASNEEPSADEEPSASNKEPSAGEEPSADKEPSAGEEPSASNKEPSAEIQPSANVEPETAIPDESIFDDPVFDFEFDHDLEQLLHDRRRFFPLASLKWLPGILLLIAMLGVQWVYLNLPAYSQKEAYREQLLTTCRLVGCSVPDYDNLEALKTRELIIRSHPEESQALMVDVLLRNSAEYRQQFPGLRLDFMDVRGNIVASRVFRANEYLGGEMRGLRYIPALTEVRLSLEIVDPGDRALGYQMEVVRI